MTASLECESRAGQEAGSANRFLTVAAQQLKTGSVSPAYWFSSAVAATEL